MEKQVVVNADDLGLTRSINESIIHAFDDGFLTSTTFLVKRPASNAAIHLLAQRPHLGVGLHLDLDVFFQYEEYGHFGTSIEDINQKIYNYAINNQIQAIVEEIEDQIQIVLNMGVRLTHVDSHHNIHLMPDVMPLVIAAMKKYNLNKIRFSKNYYRDQVDSYTKLKLRLDQHHIKYPKYCAEIDELMPLGQIFTSVSSGFSEIIVHTDLPGQTDQEWRIQQYSYLLDKNGAQLIDQLNIKLVDYSSL